jgi:VanZ family protein
MGLIFVLSSGPSIPLPSATSDKVVHASVYAILSVLFVRAFAGGLPARVHLETALLAVGASIAYGVSDEWHQLFVAGRFADRADVLADAVGAAIGAATCWAWGTIHPRSDV